MFGAQEAHPAGDFAGLSEAADRDLGNDLFEHRLGHGCDHVGVDIAGRNRIDRDAEARAFLGECLGEAVDPALGGGVVYLAILSGLSIDGTDVDDPAPAALFHAGKGGLRHVEAAAQIGAHHGVPIVIAHLQERAVARDPGVVDDDVDGAVLFRYFFAGFLHGVEIADIEFYRGNARFFGELTGRLVIAGVIGNDRTITFVTQSFANSPTDSARTAGYDCNSSHSDSPKHSVAFCLFLGMDTLRRKGNQTFGEGRQSYSLENGSVRPLRSGSACRRRRPGRLPPHW